MYCCPKIKVVIGYEREEKVVEGIKIKEKSAFKDWDELSSTRDM